MGPSAARSGTTSTAAATAADLGLAGSVAQAFPEWQRACASVKSPTKHGSCQLPASATAECQRLSHASGLALAASLGAYPDTSTVELTCDDATAGLQLLLSVFTNVTANPEPPPCDPQACKQGKAGEITSAGGSLMALISQNFQLTVTPSSLGSNPDANAAGRLFAAALAELGVDSDANYVAR